MDDVIDRLGAERVWGATVVALLVAFVGGILLFPQRFYVEFVWQYFWGPVVADAHSPVWDCVAWAGGEEISCAEAGRDDGPTASPGYTFVSYAGYIPTLILLLIGVVFLVRRLEIERYRAGFFGLFPFFLFGGALRVVEDANAKAFSETGEMAISLPWSGLLISPLIYFTVFLVALGAVVVSVWLDRTGRVEGYERPLAGIGTTLLVLTIAYLGYVTATEPYATFYPLIPTIVLVGATAATAATWWAVNTYAPDINRGTHEMGIVVIWAHAVDGVANALMLDWGPSFGLNYSPKHPVNEAIVNVTGSIQPASVTNAIGAAWPFVLVKLAAAVFVIWIFDETVFEDSPRYTILLLITVVAVGLGPGSRDMIRATFGV